ncbi:MAG: type III-A CRISPR-associated protein Cas10/Csm1 [Spirochaetales bacterium]|nr:type III-A CRISPR-associated protein Cas10/Csm1 [Spirochaetales bacterium]
MKKTLYETAIAALLHDIGKFKQRAFGGKETDSFKEIKERVCPAHLSHEHALWTFDFFEQDLLGKKSKNTLPCLGWERIRDTASLHHKNEESVVARANRMSTGRESFEAEDVMYEKGDYLKKHLKPVFPMISLKDYLHNTDDYIYRLNIPDSTSLFPVIHKNEEDLTRDYRKLWDLFIKELEFLPGDVPLFTQGLFYLLEKYTWCIPAYTHDSCRDISLFDHSVFTCALAICLQLFDEKGEQKEEPFLFFAADISGIQNYIFRNAKETGKGRAKITRARSFYVSAVSYACILALCEELALPPYVKIIDAGGKFILVLPNLEEITSALSGITEKIDRWFFKEFHGSFTILHDYSVTVSPEDLKAENFPLLMNRINFRLAKAKSTRFKTILETGDCVIDIKLTDTAVCKSCGTRNSLRTIDETNEVCDDCYRLFKTGGDLTKKRYVAFTKKGELDFFGGLLSLELDDNPDRFENPYAVFALGSGNHYPPWILNNYVPVKPDTNETLEFGEIAEQALKNGTGSPFLAFVKMDVDSLGALFVHGFRHKDEHGNFISLFSLSRYIGMSRMLNLFFNVYIKDLLKEKYSCFYTVLSGGDDLFIIMPWNRVIDFVEDVRERFRLFVCNNPDIHFSTGVEIAKESFPIHKAAARAEENIREAKDAGRNRIHYFHTVTYEKLREIHDITRWFIDKLRNNETTIKRGFVYRLLRYTREAIDFKKDEKNNVKKIMYVPQFYYDLSRNIVKKEKGKIINEEEVQEVQGYFEKYLNNVKEGKPEILETALLITLYETRERGSKG